MKAVVFLDGTNAAIAMGEDDPNCLLQIRDDIGSEDTPKWG